MALVKKGQGPAVEVDIAFCIGGFLWLIRI